MEKAKKTEVEETKTNNVVELNERANDIELLYKDLCNTMGGKVYFYKSKYVVPYVSKGINSYALNINYFSTTELRAMVDEKVSRNALVKYILLNKKLRSDILMRECNYLYKAGELREDLRGRDIYKEATKFKRNFNPDNSIMDVYIPYPKKDKNNNHLFNTLIEIIVGRDNFNIVKKFMAQYAFENREFLQRLCLIMYGDRGTGKSLFIETILGNMLFSALYTLPLDFERYDNYKTKKLIYLDEAEGKTTVLKMEVLAKKLSGQSIVAVSRKYLDNKETITRSYFALSANKKPIQISQPPTSDVDNQWLVIKTEQSLRARPEFMKFLQCPEVDGNLLKFVKESIGCWMWEDLLPFYQEHLLNNDEGRYGFRIPITEDLRELCRLSYTDDEAAVCNLLEYLENLEIDKFKERCRHEANNAILNGLFERFKTDKFLGNALMDYMLTNKFLKTERFKKILMRLDLIIKGYGSKVISICTKKCRGVYLDKKRFDELFDEELEEEKQLIDIDEDDFESLENAFKGGIE
jgi:hypothetical protein